ncbi:head-tail connector protein [Undibacterium curvum]|uniref:head-tail connector protein n=1 Tax=Undibacterium curvum TaxID=2762294 RepID=UPI003D14CDB0
MPLPTLDEARHDLRVSGNQDDAKIQRLLNAAIQSASEFINRPIPWKDDLGVVLPVPDTVYAAILLELRALYDSPEDICSPAFFNLLRPYRLGMGV